MRVKPAMTKGGVEIAGRARNDEREIEGKKLQGPFFHAKISKSK